MAGHQGEGSKRYRHVKRVVQHPNPLFDRWLAEWQAQAEATNSKLKYTYKKARKSLGLYPLPLRQGAECLHLSGFGPRLCNQLDQQLQDHVAQHGPVDWDQLVQYQEEHRGRVRSNHIRRASRGARGGRDSTRTSTGRGQTQNTNSPSTESGTKVKAGKQQRGREYVPVVRSGAYALLLTLHRVPPHPGRMKKAELLRAAQGLCDASMVQASQSSSGGVSRYTAWSSMATLVKKGLVHREGCPARFSLTDMGHQLAAKIEDSEATLGGTDSPLPCAPTPREEQEMVALGKEERTMVVHSISDESSEEETDPPLGVRAARGQGEAQAPSSSTAPGFVYVGVLGTEGRSKDSAEVMVDEDGFLGFLVKCCSEDLPRLPHHRPCPHRCAAPAGYTYTFLSNECAPDVSPGLAPAPPSLPQPTARVTISRKKKKAHSATVGEKCVAAQPKFILPHKSAFAVPSLPAPLPSSPPACSPPLLPCQATVGEELFKLGAGQYEVVLCVDSMETSGSSVRLDTGRAVTKDVIVRELERNKVRHEVRRLHVGDFLWVCRELSSHPHNQEVREVVLPWVVERKRLDDLAHSIKDGRFREQKFRLQRCGLSRPTYLVEQCASANLCLGEATCLQAVTNTQVVDGFTVKVTQDQRESAAFLTLMTRVLASLYQGRVVTAVPRATLIPGAGPGAKAGPGQVETRLQTFAEFNAEAMKTQQLSVREMLAKQLLQLHGLSVEKARAIVDQYGSPRALMAALDCCPPEQRDRLVAEVRCQRSSRSVGATLSCSLARLYTQHNLL